MLQTDLNKTTRPLAGVRIVDFTRVLAGPYCTALMADLGAEVIKIEGPGGEDYRHVGPFRDGESLLFQTVNRGKRSVVLDLKSPRGQETITSLLKTADVLIENFRPGVMAKFGMDAETLCAAHPKLVYVSISGFGHTGPNMAKPAYDIIVQALSGIMDVTGEREAPPTMVGEAIADVAGGLFAAFGTMVALFDRERSGTGRHVDLGLFDALLSMMPVVTCRALLGDSPVIRTGNRHPLSAPFGVYAARDGNFAIAVLNNRLFETFCAAMNLPELARDPRFATDQDRRTNEPQLAQVIENWAAGQNTTEVIATLEANGIPCAPIQSVADAWASPQAMARGLISVVDHPSLGALRIPEQPLHFSGAPRGGRSPAPQLGEGNQEFCSQSDEVTK
ncbi:CaiB/BaiF CoA transferase family protein [Cribrihabitans sp. XS_ASV171]